MKFRVPSRLCRSRIYSYSLKLRQRRFLLCFLTVLVVFVLLIWIKRLSSCSQQVVDNAVFNLCQLYNQGAIAGALCDDVCTSRTLNIGKCQPFHMGKEIVSKGTWNNEPIIVKSSYAEVNTYDEVSGTTQNVFDDMDLSEFTAMITSKLKHTFAINAENEPDLLKVLWPWNFTTTLNGNDSDKKSAVMKSIWRLVQQDEYVLFKLYENANIFPKILGTCGHFYVTEFVPSLSEFPLCSLLSAKSCQRIVMLNLLRLVANMQEKFHEPMHLCDIKEDHFGFDKNFHAKILDADAIFFLSPLNNLLNKTPCSVDNDCNFWDCEAKCHSETNVCGSVANSNFQVICEKLFLGKNKFFFEGRQMFVSMVQEWKDVFDIVKQCANLHSSFDVNGESMTIYKMLNAVISQTQIESTRKT